MEEVPRELFLPKAERRRAYRDGAVRIGEGRTMSQPWIVACMAQVLELTGAETVLEVGTRSGYAAAVISRLCREVVTIRALREPRGAGGAGAPRAGLRQRPRGGRRRSLGAPERRASVRSR